MDMLQYLGHGGGKLSHEAVHFTPSVDRPSLATFPCEASYLRTLFGASFLSYGAEHANISLIFPLCTLHSRLPHSDLLHFAPLLAVHRRSQLLVMLALPLLGKALISTNATIIHPTLKCLRNF